MKKLFLSALCSLAGFIAFAQGVVYGTVSTTNNVPIQNHMVYFVIDSSSTYAGVYQQYATTSAGQYGFYVSDTVANGAIIHISVLDCNNNDVTNTYTYHTGDTIVSNFTICSGDTAVAPVAGHVMGKISLGDTSVPAPDAIVYLIRDTYDAMDSSNHILTLIDSAYTDNSGNYSIAAPANYNSGTLLVKAALLSSSSNYSSFLPTYNYSSLSWSSANPIYFYLYNPSVYDAYAYITLQAGVNAGGPGFIDGSVMQGANKSTAVGDPLTNKILLLTTASGTPVAYTYSDAAGHFNFSNLAYGTYKLFGDVLGKANPALTITLSATQASVSNVIFQEHTASFNGQVGPTAVANVNKLSNISIYPNPATDNINVNGLDNIGGAKTITLSEINGAKVYTRTYDNGTKVTIPTNALSNGVYMLQVNTAEGTAQFKVVK